MVKVEPPILELTAFKSLAFNLHSFLQKFQSVAIVEVCFPAGSTASRGLTLEAPKGMLEDESSQFYAMCRAVSLRHGRAKALLAMA